MKLFRFILLLFMTLSLQAKTMLEVAHELKQERAGVVSFIFRNRVFVRPNAGITDLTDIEQVPGIGKALAIDLHGNNIKILKANTFNHPQFKNLRYLDLRASGIEVVEPGAFNGLDLRYLLLNGNKITELPEGTLSNLTGLSWLTIGNNPDEEKLLKQAKAQLPKARVTNRRVTNQFIKRALLVVGIAAVAIGLVLHEIRKSSRELVMAARFASQEKEAVLTAAQQGSDALQEALDRGNHINAMDKFRRNALWWAAYNGNVEAVDALVAQGADFSSPDFSNTTPLMAAASQGRKNVVSILADLDQQNINTIDDFKKSALLYAALGGYQDVVDVLKIKGATVDLRLSYALYSFSNFKNLLFWKDVRHLTQVREERPTIFNALKSAVILPEARSIKVPRAVDRAELDELKETLSILYQDDGREVTFIE